MHPATPYIREHRSEPGLTKIQHYRSSPCRTAVFMGRLHIVLGCMLSVHVKNYWAWYWRPSNILTRMNRLLQVWCHRHTWHNCCPLPNGYAAAQSPGLPLLSSCRFQEISVVLWHWDFSWVRVAPGWICGIHTHENFLRLCRSRHCPCDHPYHCRFLQEDWATTSQCDRVCGY